MVLATIVAPTIGSIVYTVLVFAGSSDTRGVADAETWELILPAMLVGMLFEVFVLLPLWHLLQPPRRHARLLFVSLGAAAWLFCTAVLLVLTKLRGAEILVEATQLFLPGLILVLVFDMLARRETNSPARVR